MEETEGPVDPLHGDIAVALFALTGDVHIIEREVFKLFQRPWR